jgi:hypothetical protein
MFYFQLFFNTIAGEGHADKIAKELSECQQTLPWGLNLYVLYS